MQIPVLVTGTTGFVGSHFLLWLSQHRASQVYALIRGRSDDERTSKLGAALRAAGEGYPRVPDLDKIASDTRRVAGDIERPLCGVSEVDLLALRGAGIREVWHFAATLSFEEKHRDLIRSQNIGGPRHAIELASRLGAERFIYVSTAYTAGAADGRFSEELHSRERPFANAYEESKCEAEHTVDALCRERGLSLLVLRPSIVIGSSATFAPCGTAAGLYGFIREIHRLRRRLARTDHTVRLQALPDVLLNFVPIDAVMRDIMSVIDRSFDVAPILHLSAEGGISVALLVSSIARHLGIDNLVVAPADAATWSPLEQVLARRIAFYASYLRSHKEFVRSLHSRWVVSEDDFEQHVARGVGELGTRVKPRADSA
jgi:nucleoside-diphosphate-sugar epimerase